MYNVGMEYPNDYINKIICGDNLLVMKTFPDKVFNLIVADPPYNIGKADWDKIPNYIEWLGMRLLEMQRVLKNNGSLYLFHNDFLQMVEIQNWINRNSKFVFKQLIVWDKWHNPFGKGNNLQGAFFKIVHNPNLRNYPKMAEYILFYTFQDETGSNIIKSNRSLFKSIKQYLRSEKNKSGMTLIDLNELLVNKRQSDCIAKRYFGDSQWELPTLEMYQKLQTTGYFQKPYGDLRLEYDNLRYTFNQYNNNTSIWNYPITNIKDRVNHLTQKPIPLIKNILKHSSNEGDLVLVPFVGSGNDCIACKELKRNYIGIEDKEEYVKMARDRIKAIPELLF